MKSRLTEDLETYVCGAMVLTLLLLVFAEVVARTVLGSSVVWIEEVSRILFIWAVFFGTSAGIKKNAHISIDTLVRRMPREAQKRIEWLTFSAQFLTISFLLYSGFILIARYGDDQFIVTGLPRSVLYYCMPITGALMLFRLAQKILKKVS